MTTTIRTPRGWAAITRAADRAMRQPGPDPSDPREPCSEMVRQLDEFENDLITDAYGLGSEMNGLVARRHVERHSCQGWGES